METYDSERAELSPTARLRVESVRWIARLLGVPIQVAEFDMHEVKVRNIADYLRECHEIAETVFEMSTEDLVTFHQWAYHHLHEMIDNPFCMHDHPLYFVASFEGIWDHTDPRMKEIEEKFTDAKIKLRWPNGDG